MQEYLEGSARTTAHTEVRDDIYPTHNKLANDIVTLISNGQIADLMKRSLFYKEAQAKTQERADGYKADNIALYQSIEKMDLNRKFGTVEIDIAHAALGLMSEAAEVLEEIVKAFVEGRPFDLTNLREEAGDVLWYEALLLRSVESTFEAEGARNLNKLKKRYPEKFTSEDALNRDLAGEQKVLSA